MLTRMFIHLFSVSCENKIFGLKKYILVLFLFEQKENIVNFQTLVPPKKPINITH